MSEKYAIEATDVTKVYRRFGRRRQFATLKSALVSGTLFRDLRPDETFYAVRGVTFQVPRLERGRNQSNAVQLYTSFLASCYCSAAHNGPVSAGRNQPAMLVTIHMTTAIASDLSHPILYRNWSASSHTIPPMIAAIHPWPSR